MIIPPCRQEKVIVFSTATAAAALFGLAVADYECGYPTKADINFEVFTDLLEAI
jgi:hypothetical protein